MNYLAVETGFNVSGGLNRNIAQFCVAAGKSTIDTALLLPNAAYLQLLSLFILFFYTSYIRFSFSFICLLVCFFFVCSLLTLRRIMSYIYIYIYIYIWRTHS